MKFIILFAALLGTGLCVLFPGGPEEGECGCCPEPCCCVCIDQTPTLPPTTTTTSTTTTTTTTTSTTSTTTPFKPICNVTQEIAIVLDSSGSIGETDWAVALQFVNDIIDSFATIGAAGTRVGFVTYSTNATTHFNLNSDVTLDRDTLKQAVSEVPLQGRFTNTPEALEKANTEIFNAPGDKPEIPNVAIVISDGRLTHRKNEFEALANALKESAEVIAIGVTDQISQEDLEIIATGGAENTFSVNEFSELESILNRLVSKACTKPPTRPPPVTKPPRTPKPPRPTKPPVTPRPTPMPVRECFCCCPPPPGAGRPHDKCW